MKYDLKILICPRCQEALASPDRCRACGTNYQSAAGLPVLIDFEESICRPDDFVDAVTITPRRGGFVGRALHRLTYGTSDVSTDNFGFFANSNGKGRVLIIGGGSEGTGTKPLYDHPDLEIVGTDIYPSAGVSIICDAHSLPFADDTFEGVIIQAVLEHVLDPNRVVTEIERVLKPCGIVYAETPFLQAVHMGAYDFTRFTKSGHRWLFRRFTELKAGTVLGPGVVAMWSLNHLFAGAFGRRIAVILSAIFAWLRLLDRPRDLCHRADGASAVFFLGRLDDPKLKPSEMRDYYSATAKPPGLRTNQP